MEKNIDLKKYQEFVKAVTSKPSMELEEMMAAMQKIEKESYFTVNPSLLMTAAIGLSAEGGEFAEIVKKMVFQGKPINPETRFHMQRELGDILWYWINACTALELDPNVVIKENVRKLESRYPGGRFDVTQSENRDEGDL